VLYFIPPAQPRVRSVPPSGPGWLHEVKFDGWRVQLHKDGGDVAILSRRGKDLTRRFRQAAAATAALPARSCVLDGELTMLNSVGVPDFNALMLRRGLAPVCVWLFDLLELDGGDLRNLPLIERRRELAKVLRRSKSDLLRLSASFNDGERLLAIAEQMGLEGIVSKRRDAPYRSGPRSGWVKVKAASRREANEERGRLLEDKA
jgi:bifunctional non-homologous end joining protein LigD